MANTTFEGYLNYTKDIASIKSHIEAVAGYAYYDYLTTTYNFPDRTYDMTVVSSPAFPFDKPEHRLQSFYGRLNYTYDDKYILTGTVRRDGSSRFSPLNKYAVFPSGAFAWRLKEENFLKDSKTISDLKLRVGYGTTGQQDGLDNYGYTSLYALSSPTAEYQLGNSFYQLYRPSAYDPKRKWEQSATTNLGIDYGFLNNRITGSIDAYYKNTKDLLGTVNIPAGAGFSNTFITNVGNMVNRGIEFNINGALIQRDDFSWNAAFNLTYNESKITKLTFFPNPTSPGNTFGSINGGTGTTAQVNTVGYAPNSFYVYQQVYDASGKPIDGVFVDRNGDGTINTSDLYRYKSSMPKYFMGFSTNITYKKWTAGVVMRASLGNYAYNNVASSTGTQNNIINPLGYINNGSTDVLTTGFSGKSDKTILSDYYVQNASFLKMDNASVGYNFGKILKGTANFSLNANVQNVFTVTKYTGVDPEISNGLDKNLYPRPRTFVLGANIKF
jgi:iron complex outermembrane receptor protein